VGNEKQNVTQPKVHAARWQRKQEKPLVEIAASIGITLIIAWIFYDAWYGILLFPAAYIVFSRGYQQVKKERENQRKSHAFKEMLEMLAGFLQAGISLENSFLHVEEQIEMLGIDGREVAVALHKMNQKVKVNVPVEKACMEMTEQIALAEAIEFGEVLYAAKRLGGNYGRNVQRCAEKIGEKLSLQEEIETIMAQKKLEMKIMWIVPIVIIGYVRVTSSDLLQVLYHNMLGVCIMSACLVCYVLMVWWSRRMMDISM
jgi:tight adherence protein B